MDAHRFQRGRKESRMKDVVERRCMSQAAKLPTWGKTQWLKDKYRARLPTYLINQILAPIGHRNLPVSFPPLFASFLFFHPISMATLSLHSTFPQPSRPFIIVCGFYYCRILK
jgi:hypothetical protein